MRHSLFFGNLSDAQQAQEFVNTGIRVKDCMITNDGESGQIEVRFWTETVLVIGNISRLFVGTRPQSYKLNQEDQ